jgi:hypothetical protein
MASSQKRPFYTQQAGCIWPGFSFAIRLSSCATKWFGSQNCLARASGILRSVLQLGARQSVGRIGSQTTSTRSSGSGFCFRICSAAEAPRRHVIQVGDKSKTRRGPSIDLSNEASKSAKLPCASVASGSCPGGTADPTQRYAAPARAAAAIIPMVTEFIFTSGPRQTDRR